MHIKKAFRSCIAFLAIVISMCVPAGPFAKTIFAEAKPAGTSLDHKIAVNFGGKTNPVDVVIGAAEVLGLNPKSDTFSVISETPSLKFMDGSGDEFQHLKNKQSSAASLKGGAELNIYMEIHFKMI